MVFLRRHLRQVFLIAAIVLLGVSAPALAATEPASSSSATLTVTLEVQSTLSLSNDGQAYSAYPVTSFIDEDTGVVTYSVIDGG